MLPWRSLSAPMMKPGKNTANMKKARATNTWAQAKITLVIVIEVIAPNLFRNIGCTQPLKKTSSITAADTPFTAHDAACEKETRRGRSSPGQFIEITVRAASATAVTTAHSMKPLRENFHDSPYDSGVSPLRRHHKNGVSASAIPARVGIRTVRRTWNNDRNNIPRRPPRTKCRRTE